MKSVIIVGKVLSSRTLTPRISSVYLGTLREFREYIKEVHESCNLFGDEFYVVENTPENIKKIFFLMVRGDPLDKIRKITQSILGFCEYIVNYSNSKHEIGVTIGFELEPKSSTWLKYEFCFRSNLPKDLIQNRLKQYPVKVWYSKITHWDYPWICEESPEGRLGLAQYEMGEEIYYKELPSGLLKRLLDENLWVVLTEEKSYILEYL